MEERGDIFDRIIESKKGAICIGVIAIVLGIFFCYSGVVTNRKAERHEVEVHRGEFIEYIQTDDSKSIILSDGSEHCFYPHTDTSDFDKAMATLPVNTVLELSVSIHNGCVVEVIEFDTGRVLLDFDKSQDDVERYVVGYAYIGCFVVFAGIFFIIFAMLRSSHEAKEKTRLSSKDPSIILRKADNGTKRKILLMTTFKGYNIVYRRTKSVNELVVNGEVYDELRAILEFPHKLVAEIDGTVIEAGLDKTDHSYIAVNGDIIAKKKRLI